jgi:hypothetical protein
MRVQELAKMSIFINEGAAFVKGGIEIASEISHG